MNREDLRAYCLSKHGAFEDFPFGEDAAVFKVAGKMFALIPTKGPNRITLKCDPMFAIVLRDTYPAVTPAWHFNKKHWNGVEIDGSVPDNEVYAWIDHSYELVVKGLTKAERKTLGWGA